MLFLSSFEYHVKYLLRCWIVSSSWNQQCQLCDKYDEFSWSIFSAMNSAPTIELRLCTAKPRIWELNSQKDCMTKSASSVMQMAYCNLHRNNVVLRGVFKVPMTRGRKHLTGYFYNQFTLIPLDPIDSFIYYINLDLREGKRKPHRLRNYHTHDKWVNQISES